MIKEKFEPDTGNEKFFSAFQIAEYTNESFFLTGKAGTGKSTFLKYFRENTHKKYVVLAPTGVAALNVSGQTIHSFFQFPQKPLSGSRDIPIFRSDVLNEVADKIRLITELDTLIIDEISMVRADILDGIDYSLRHNGGDASKPFGGKQIIFVGDLLQLPPVVTETDKQLIELFYPQPYFFAANIFSEINLGQIELDKVYRQQDNDFIRLLDAVRENKLSAADLAVFNERFSSDFQPDPTNFFIILSTTNRVAKESNAVHLGQLSGKEFKYEGKTEGDFPEKELPVESALKLKVNAQVMFMRNDPYKRWMNGTIGRVESLSEKEIRVRLPDGAVYLVEPVEWENREFGFDKESKSVNTKVKGTFMQYPLRLAWAITVHKSQGLTFEKMILDTTGGIFLFGQLYVALSRCKTLSGLILKRKLQPKDNKVDNVVLDFIRTAEIKDVRKIISEGGAAWIERLHLQQERMLEEIRQLEISNGKKSSDQDASARLSGEQSVEAIMKHITQLYIHNEKLRECLASLYEEEFNDRDSYDDSF